MRSTSYGRVRLICSWLDNDAKTVLMTWSQHGKLPHVVGQPESSSFPTIFVDAISGVITEDEKTSACYMEIRYNGDNTLIKSQSCLNEFRQGTRAIEFIHSFSHQNMYLIPDSRLAAKSTALSTFPFVPERADQGGRHGQMNCYGLAYKELLSWRAQRGGFLEEVRTDGSQTNKKTRMRKSNQVH